MARACVRARLFVCVCVRVRVRAAHERAYTLLPPAGRAPRRADLRQRHQCGVDPDVGCVQQPHHLPRRWRRPQRHGPLRFRLTLTHRPPPAATGSIGVINHLHLSCTRSLPRSLAPSRALFLTLV